MEDSSSTIAFKTGDRVSRIGVEGPIGTVCHVRVESVRESIKQKGGTAPGVSVTVLWDNGTTSHFVTESLEKN